MLSQLVDQYRQRHSREPDEIVVHPVALAALTIKQSVAPKWNGIPVKCEVTKPVGAEDITGRKMGVTVINGALRAFDL